MLTLVLSGCHDAVKPEQAPVSSVCIWALHFLSTSEEVQDKLYQELNEVLGSDPVSLDKIPQLR